MEAVKDLKNQNLWNYFYEITKIPRESGNEKQIRDYLIQEAQKHNFAYVVDRGGNLIIRAEATKGYENYPSLAFQGHMDMVCVKDDKVEHDFTKDPIDIYRDGDWIKAKGTTLGADNGVAIALVLDLFTDKEAQHGPLEAIFTVSEETGLEGAFNLDPSMIKSKKMVNLDSEEESVIYIGCAGGVETSAEIPVDAVVLDKDRVTVEIEVGNLLGGHSGGEIHKQRGNAISIMARICYDVIKEIPFNLISIEGGTKRNVIPSICKALLCFDKNKSDRLFSIIDKTTKVIKEEYKEADANLSVGYKIIKEVKQSGYSLQSSLNVIKALFVAPHGVVRMSQTIEGMVETSSNLAIVKSSGAFVKVISSHRSAVGSAKESVAKKWAVLFSSFGSAVKTENPYPAWTPNPNSEMAKLAKVSWKKHMGSDAKITAIHAGLECGIINSVVEGMDSISLGPNLKDVHSTKERLSISSTEKIGEFIRHLVLDLGDL